MPKQWILRAFAVFCVVVAFAGAAGCSHAQTWVGSWGSAQLEPYGSEVLPPNTFDHATLREVVHLSVGGNPVRVRLSNVFGRRALEIDVVHVAFAAQGGGIREGTVRELRFNGQPSVSVPMGAEYISDPVDLQVGPLSDLVIDLTIRSAPAEVTLHTGARATSYLVAGSHGGETNLSDARTFTRWYFLSGVEVRVRESNAAMVVALGDSITDGHGATLDRNERWPDFLAHRLSSNKKTRALGVVNAGIGGNHMLYDGLGPNALSRFDRDVLARPGARYLLVLEGINDIGGLDRLEDHDAAAHAALLAQLEAAFRQIILRAHEHGITVYGCTLTPFIGSDYYHPSVATENDRVALNEWIRNSKAFDSVIDFDALVRDPQHPERLLAADDSGDHLHPSPEGYRRMGEGVPLGLFEH